MCSQTGETIGKRKDLAVKCPRGFFVACHNPLDESIMDE
jgi:hypothetical protein